jgi:hypothetical protein
MTLRRQSISETGDLEQPCSDILNISRVTMFVEICGDNFYVHGYRKSTYVVVVNVNHIHHTFTLTPSTTCETLLQTHSRPITGKLGPKQCKRPLSPIRSRRERTAERKLVVREVKIPVARNRHCFVLVTSHQMFRLGYLRVSTQLILGSLVNSVIVPFAGL